MNFKFDEFITEALKEDINHLDITTEYIVDRNSLCQVDLIAKETGILAGLEIFQRVFQILGEVNMDFYYKDADLVEKGDFIARLKGSTKNILMGERLALNLLQRMSGIASLVKVHVDRLDDPEIKILDTRKTTPGLRSLEKYAVTCGGGFNHRFNLSDGVLIKDNHIDAAGNIKKAVNLIRNSPVKYKPIEVEVESFDELDEALEAQVEIIMLDNMSIDEIKKACDLINKQALIEVSGNINLENIHNYRGLNIDYLSIGALTHSYSSLDMSLKNLKIRSF